MAKNINRSVSTTNKSAGTITIDDFGGLSLYLESYKGEPTLRYNQGTYSSYVVELQHELNIIHDSGFSDSYLIKHIDEDGYFGSDTLSDVKALQAFSFIGGEDYCAELTQDGIVGQYTWGKLNMLANE
ncbi:peptidoglycan-binding protein [Clostridium neuense]|uniref:Peptidoglycan-binding protein n=1 Tax=Clostridium neuense TaxID=1728934 RepID=A0ABW8TJI7_9CLOT